jgi:hypothetical protein
MNFDIPEPRGKGITAEMIERAAARVHRNMAEEADLKLKGKPRREAAGRTLIHLINLFPWLLVPIVVTPSLAVAGVVAFVLLATGA